MTAQGRVRSTKRTRERWGYLPYLLPAAIVLIATLLYPLVHSLVTSFTNTSLYDLSNIDFIGFDNYAEILAPDSRFWPSVRLTGIFTAVSVLFEFVLGLAIALLLNIDIRGAKIARTLVLLPMMLTPIVLALVWKMLYNGDFGLLNWVLSLVGIDGPQWLASTSSALLAVIVVEVWQNTSYAVLIFLASLQGISDEVIEAAHVDGAGWLRTTWHIVIPYLRPALVMVLIIRTLFAFRAFETIFALTAGGPADSTTILSLYLQRTAFRSFDLGYASAIGWLMFLMALGISVVYLVALRERKPKAEK